MKILYRIGVAYLSQNNLVEAEKYLRRAYLLNPTEKEVMKALERVEAQANRSSQKR